MAMAAALRRRVSLLPSIARQAARFNSAGARETITEAEIVQEHQPIHEDQQQQQQQQQQQPIPQEYVPPPRRYFDNAGVPLALVIMGRVMQMKFQDQKEFDAMLHKTEGFGVIPVDEPENMLGKLHELDPKKVYAVVDSKAVLKMTKKMAREEAKKEGYPPDFLNMMTRGKYGRYVSDSEDD